MIEELKDSIDEIVENLIEYKDCICIDDGNLEELLDEEERKKEAMLNFAQRFNEHLKIKNSKEDK